MKLVHRKKQVQLRIIGTSVCFKKGGGAYHFPLVRTPRCLDFGVGPRADGLAE